MTPALARFIRLARNRIYGTQLSEQAAAHIQRAEAIEEFKLFLARKIDLNVRFELYSKTEWQWSPDGSSLAFTVDSHRFVLQQIEGGCKILHRVEGQDVLLTSLADDGQFEDRLLIPIDDAFPGRLNDSNEL
jgi:hypothetical protein